MTEGSSETALSETCVHVWVEKDRNTNATRTRTWDWCNCGARRHGLIVHDATEWLPLYTGPIGEWSYSLTC